MNLGTISKTPIVIAPGVYSLWSSPRIHATPLFHPESLMKVRKTKSPDWKFGDAVDRHTIMMTTAPVSDLIPL